MFGRRKQDEDPFAALKDGGTYQSSPTTIPDIGDSGLPAASASAPAITPSPATVATPPPPMTPPAVTSGVTTPPPATPPPPSTSFGQMQSYGSYSRRRRYGVGYGWAIVLRILIPIVVIGAFAIPAIHIGHSVSKLSIPSFSTPSTPTTAPSTPAPSRPVSYLRPRGVRAGLARISKLVPGARLMLVRLDDHSLAATAIPPHGGAKEIFLGPSGTIVTSTPSPGQQPIPMSAIRPSVVARLVALMGARFHVPAKRIDYMVTNSPPRLTPHWVIFSKGAAHRGYTANLDGSGLAPIPG